MAIKPANRPQMDHLEALNILGAAGLSKSKACFLMLRGYFLDTMGVKGKNDRRIYDDALFYVEANQFLACNANADPNGYRSGHGEAEDTMGMLTIKDPQICYYKPGLHKGRPAFRQNRPLYGWRDADSSVKESKIQVVDGIKVYTVFGEFAANLHDSPETSTSSLGCLTVPKPQFVPMRDFVYARMKALGMKEIPLFITRR